jgi:hypothetical protein
VANSNEYNSEVLSMMKDIKLGLFFNDNREKPTHPQLKNGKPQNINGTDYWVSAWVNYPKEDETFAQRVIAFLMALQEKNGTYPIISVSLRAAEQQYSGSGNQAAPEVKKIDDDIPF